MMEDDMGLVNINCKAVLFEQWKDVLVRCVYQRTKNGELRKQKRLTKSD
jgi:hypothetical protein